MRGTLSSASRARAFLWLVWWYLESDFTREDAQKNPFGPGQYGENEEGTGVLPLKVPTLDSLTEEQAALENLDTEEEQHFGEVKRKERIAILASEPSPAMTALKRARKEKGLTSGSGQGYRSEDEGSEAGWYQRPQGKQMRIGSVNVANIMVQSHLLRDMLLALMAIVRTQSHHLPLSDEASKQSILRPNILKTCGSTCY